MYKNMFIIFLILCFIANNQAGAFSRFRVGKSMKWTRVGSTDTSQFDAKMQLFSDLLSEEILEHSETDSVMMKKADEITRLPGQPNDDVVFKQYGGYVTVNSTAGRAFYYYFVEAQKSPDKLPLILWLNGGPGCSSLGYGAFTEIGPFRVNSDGKTLFKNEFAWNKVANVLFLDSPAGVGFSYSNKTDENWTGDDNTTAVDNYIFLRKWLERFPEFKMRPFYICGESYAGHYVPQLAEIILRQKKKKPKTTIVNLQGVLLGNAVIDAETEFKGMADYFGGHALISDDAAHDLRTYCDYAATNQSKKCQNALDEVENVYEEIYLSNLYYPDCWNPKLTQKPKKTSIFEFDPCSDDYVQAYMNRDEVQKALHANATKMIPYIWQVCRYTFFYNWTYSSSSILPQLKFLMNKDLRVWMFSGDVDAIEPFTTTQLALKKMKLTVKTPWRPWIEISNPQQVAGFTQDYVGNLTFTTVRGSGHRVPSYKPSEAIVLIDNFLVNKKLPHLPRPGARGN